MPRPAGARNHDFDEKRQALLETLTDFALQASLSRPSLRQFAIAAHQSEPTLRHYFGDRQGLVIEIIEHIASRAEDVWRRVSKPSPDPAAAIQDYLGLAEKGMAHGNFTRAHAFGLIEGFADPVVGEVYLQKILEPSLAAFADKLRMTPGGMTDEAQLRAATLAVTAPILILGIHQTLLGGKDSLPIDESTTFAHLQRWLSAGFSSG